MFYMINTNLMNISHAVLRMLSKECFIVNMNRVILVDAGDVFVGAADFNEEGNFKWANGDPVQQTMWRHSDPNGGSAQNCVAIYSHSYSYKLTDEGCSNDYEYLCQIPLSLE